MCLVRILRILSAQAETSGGKRLFQLTGTPEPLRALARELAAEVRVLCFDELFVNDIGDAIILGNLLQVMFEEGVLLVRDSHFDRNSVDDQADRGHGGAL